MKTARAKKTAATPLQWRLWACRMAKIDRGDGRLLVMEIIQQDDGTHTVLALEGDQGASAQQILDKHAHAIVGTYAVEQDAQTAAESYAAAWLKKWKVAKIKECGCGEVAPAHVHVQHARARRAAS